MKTVFDSNPEFSLTYTHRGISVTLTGKVLTQDYLSIGATHQDNEELNGILLEKALPEAAQQAAQSLTKLHSAFDGFLSKSLDADLVRSLIPPIKKQCNQCSATILAEHEDRENDQHKQTHRASPDC